MPLILAAFAIAAPCILHAATVRRVKRKAAHKARLHSVPRHHVAYVRTRRKITHAVPSHRAKRKYYRPRYHKYRRTPRRVSRFRTQVRPSSNRIDQIQQALARAGFYQGDPSGQWDSSTIGAMRDFQVAHGLNPTGKIDATTLQQLGLGSDVAGLAPPRPLIADNSSGSSE
ncbi:MAG TPA: peptidoglycan-binding domain-containing protein [Candidatus Dormibacteraeota bacterium]|nr:peptidoglycan-binding domain-containing protein [Candidatus Dormibacteraeota bacterium]